MGCFAAVWFHMGDYKKEGDRLCSRVCCDRTGGRWFQTKRLEIQNGCKEKAFYTKGGETLAQVAQRVITGMG